MTIGKNKNPSLSDTLPPSRLGFPFVVPGLCSTHLPLLVVAPSATQKLSVRARSCFALLDVSSLSVSCDYSYSPTCHRYPRTLCISSVSRMVFSCRYLVPAPCSLVSLSHFHSEPLHISTSRMAGAVGFLIIASCVSSLHEQYIPGCPRLVLNTLYSMTSTSVFISSSRCSFGPSHHPPDTPCKTLTKVQRAKVGPKHLKVHSGESLSTVLYAAQHAKLLVSGG